MSSLSQLIGQIESGNNPNAPLVDYAGNTSVNAQFQQSAGWIAQFGSGATGIDNEAQQILANNPNATLGDFYSAYNHGSVLDWGTYSSRFPLQANNFLTNAQNAGYDQNTPLSQLTGASGPTVAGGGDSVTMNPNDPAFGDITGYPVQGVNAGGIVSGLPNDPATAVTSGDLSSLLGGGGGTPVNITDLPGLDKSVTGGAGTVATGVTGAATSLGGTIASFAKAIQTYTSNIFVMIALVVLGLIFVAFGLGLFGKRELAAAV